MGLAQVPHSPLQGVGGNQSNVSEGTRTLQSDDWITDLELMHNYTTKAYLTLPRADEVGHLWQVEVVELALSYKYLLHLILAFSAFHLAHSRLDQQRGYYYAGARHQNRGVRDMRLALVGLNAESCHSLFMAASFLVIGNFAAFTVNAGNEVDQHPTVEDMVDIFVLLKGMSTVLQSWEEVIQRGPFTRLFEPSAVSSASLPFWNDVNERLHHVRKLLGAKLAEDPAMAALIDDEAQQLSNIYQRSILSSVPELRFVMQWPIHVSDGYIKLLREKSPAALVMLSYYCVVVHAAESKTWFTKGWASNLLPAVEALLPPTWDKLIHWPLERIYSRTP